MNQRPEIYQFLNYREYLRAMYDFMKENLRGFSFRRFGQMAGLDSPNYLKMVMDGDRNLGDSTIPKFAKALKLNKQESTYFAALVPFTQTTDATAKQEAYQRMLKILRMRKIRELETTQYDYFSKWYHAAIREMILFDGFREDPEWIAKQLSPRINTKEAEQSLKLLLQLGFLKRNSDGRLEQSESTLASAPEIRSLALQNFHQQMLENAKRALTEISAEMRDITAITLGLTEADVPHLKKKILAFRRNLLAEFGANTKVSGVYQMNVQLFPLTTDREGENRE